jgi:hypothetical protein
MRIAVVLAKLAFFFRRVENFKMDHRVAIKFFFFFVKLKKTAFETFEMLKSAYGEECLSRINVFESHKGFKEGLRK